MQKLTTGTIIDNKYCVLDFLGIGGMGIVYKVEQLSLTAIRALKIIDTDKLSDDSWRRFELEARAASAFEHTNVIKVYDYGLFNKLTPYYVMEVVDGMTLGERINIEGPISIEQFFEIFIPVAQALAYIHSKGVLHRDIKPANIMIVEDSNGKITVVKVLDFGLVKMFSNSDVGAGALSKAGALTKAGEVIGSPTFMSPEQTAGHKLDQRSDIYSLGCAMFEALAGDPPYLDNNPVEVMIMHQSEPIPSLAEMANQCEFDERIELLVRVMLAKKPNDRHQTMDEVVHDLISIQSGRQPLFAREHWQSTNPRQSYEGIENNSKRLDSNGSNNDIGNEGNEIAGEEQYEEEVARVHKRKNRKSNRARLNLITYATLSITAILTMTAASAIVLQNLNEKRTVDTYASVRSFSRESTTADGSKVLVFDFPKEYSIGEICTANYEHRVNAQGTVTLPSNEIFRFWANKACMKNPKLLEQFKSTEIGELDLSVLPGANDEHLAAIRHFRRLGKLNISYCTLSPSGIADLDCLTALQDLTINGATIDDQAFSKLKILGQLSTLEAKETPAFDKTIAALSGSTNVQKLVLCNGALTDQNVKMIGKNTSLVYLNLALNPAITSEGVKALATCKQLKNLNLIQDPITPSAISTLSGLKELNSLKLSCLNWKEEDENILKRNLPQNCSLQIIHMKSTKAGKALDNLTRIGL